MAVDRQQMSGIESVVNTRQDRNTIVAGGGTWTWNSTTGVLAWSDTIRIMVGGLGTHTIASGSVTLSASGKIAAAVVNRSTPGATSLVAKDGNSVDFLTDTLVAVAFRATDGRLYLRDGSVLETGLSYKMGRPPTAVVRRQRPADNRPAGSSYEYLLGFRNFTEADGAIVDPNFTTLESALGNFVVRIPNTGGVPDIETWVEIGCDAGDTQFVIRKVASVVDATHITFDGAGLGAETNLTYCIVTGVMSYENGAQHLLVSANGVLQHLGIDYNEVGTPGQVKSTIKFLAGHVPAAGQMIVGINLTPYWAA